MSVVNCKRCGRMFNKIRSPICRDCEKTEDEQFQKLRDFIEESPLATMVEVVSSTGVPHKRILQYIRDGRLQVTKGLSGELRCVSCGTEIEKGNFCEACTKKVHNEFSDSSAALKRAVDSQKKEVDSTKIGTSSIRMFTKK